MIWELNLSERREHEMDATARATQNKRKERERKLNPEAWAEEKKLKIAQRDAARRTKDAMAKRDSRAKQASEV